MRSLKVSVIILLFASVVLTVSCSVDEPNQISSNSAETSNSVYDISQAVNAFVEFTDKNDIENILTATVHSVSTTINELTSEKDTTAKKTTSTEKATEATTTEKVTETTTAAPVKSTVKITIAEGQTMTQIFKNLEENGVASFDALMETAQSYDYSYYPLVAKIPTNANRCFKLEGYLYPDTYEFYTNQKPQDAIGKFLRNGKAKITDSMIAQASALGYSMDEVITVASIIEKEGANSKEIAKIAAVIYNRLEAGMKLQMDSSIYYIERHVKPYISGDINRYNSHYNTYKCSALPAGPISNPGLRTIRAALEPADVPYIYFCHDENANYYYAETYEDHQKNLKLAGIE